MKKTIFSILYRISMFIPNSFLEKILKFASIGDLLNRIINPHDEILIKVMGKKMHVNSSDIGVASPLIKFGIYEEYETEIFKKIIKSNTILIDIGANIGYYTLIAAEKIKEGRIYSFEPVLYNYHLLNKNINVNNYDNIKTFQKAVSDKNGESRIFLDRTNLGNHSMTKNNVVDESNFIEIETITLDSFFNDLENLSEEDILIKMDTQGAEGLIIEGAQNVLLKDNVKILMEFWPKGLMNMGTDPLELLNKLQNYGFKIRLLDETNKSLKDLNKNEIIDYCHDPENVIDQANLFLEKGKSI